MDIFAGIFLISFVGLLIVWCYHRINGPVEGFQGWVKSSLDKQARTGNSCNVLETFPDTELSGAVIEIVADSCESGLPHTVGLHQIRIPQAAWNARETRRQSILRHERVHLLQRRYVAEWENFYRREWQYSLHEVPPTGIEDAAVRGNPDTYPKRWAAWKDRYWFVPVYRDKAAPQLADAPVKVWDSQASAWLPEAPMEWRTTFCTEQGKCPHQWEHPAEISAEYITDGDWTTPAAMRLRKFMEGFV
jgi:hypothetical protein